MPMVSNRHSYYNIAIFLKNLNLQLGLHNILKNAWQFIDMKEYSTPPLPCLIKRSKGAQYFYIVEPVKSPTLLCVYLGYTP